MCLTCISIQKWLLWMCALCMLHVLMSFVYALSLWFHFVAIDVKNCISCTKKLKYFIKCLIKLIVNCELDWKQLFFETHSTNHNEFKTELFHLVFHFTFAPAHIIFVIHFPSSYAIVSFNFFSPSLPPTGKPFYLAFQSWFVHGRLNNPSYNIIYAHTNIVY